MGKKVYFLDSVKQSDGSYSPTYGAGDINAAVSCIVGAGVAPFTGSDSFTASDLNSLTEFLVSEGTNNGMKITVTSDTEVIVGRGIVYFSNGAMIEVDSDGVEIVDSSVKEKYVYAYMDTIANSCGFKLSSEVPTETESEKVVQLAYIESDSTVTDWRTFARCKLPTMGGNAIRTLEFEKLTVNSEKLFNIPLTGFNRVIVSYTIASDIKGISHMAVIDAATGIILYALYDDDDSLHYYINNDYICYRTYKTNFPCYIRADIKDGKLRFHAEKGSVTFSRLMLEFV